MAPALILATAVAALTASPSVAASVPVDAPGTTRGLVMVLVPEVHISSPVDPNPLQAKDAVPKATWIHLAATYDGAVARLYVNGVEVASGPFNGGIPSDVTPLILGGNGNYDTVTELFRGKIDELMLYGRALSAGEIAELAAGAPFPGGPVDGSAD